MSSSRRMRRDLSITAAQPVSPTHRRTRRSLDDMASPLPSNNPPLLRVKRLDDEEEEKLHPPVAGLQRMKRIDTMATVGVEELNHGSQRRQRRALNYDPQILIDQILDYMREWQQEEEQEGRAGSKGGGRSTRGIMENRWRMRFWGRVGWGEEWRWGGGGVFCLHLSVFLFYECSVVLLLLVKTWSVVKTAGNSWTGWCHFILFLLNRIRSGQEWKHCSRDFSGLFHFSLMWLRFEQLL